MLGGKLDSIAGLPAPVIKRVRELMPATSRLRQFCQQIASSWTTSHCESHSDLQAWVHYAFQLRGVPRPLVASWWVRICAVKLTVVSPGLPGLEREWERQSQRVIL